jgi:hypothetical protein
MPSESLGLIKLIQNLSSRMGWGGGAFFQKVNGSMVLMIALTKKRRLWFDNLWNYPLNLPLILNA